MYIPHKNGLSEFPLDVNIFEADYKVTKLYDRYGPRGFTVYIGILCIIYRDGYYLEIPMEGLHTLLKKMIGSRWLDTTSISNIISYCGEIGLFDKNLLEQGVITSVDIQKRYKEANKRSKLKIEKYRLLELDSPNHIDN